MENSPSSESEETEKIRQTLTLEFRGLLTNYKDEIPDQIINSNSPDTGYKVQKGVWFQAIANSIWFLLHHNQKTPLLSKNLLREVHEYNSQLTDPNHEFKKRLTEQKDIDQAETLINKIIIELEQ